MGFGELYIYKFFLRYVPREVVMFNFGRFVDPYDSGYVVWYFGPFSWEVRERLLNYVWNNRQGDWNSRTLISLQWTKRSLDR